MMHLKHFTFMGLENAGFSAGYTCSSMSNLFITKAKFKSNAFADSKPCFSPPPFLLEVAMIHEKI
jgi:hypothetical protein